MLMTLFRWQSKILNKLYKTERYNKLTALKLTNPQQIDYRIFFEETPQINIKDYLNVIESSNKLCKITTRVEQLQQSVVFLNQYIKQGDEMGRNQRKFRKIYKNKSVKNNCEVIDNNTNMIDLSLEHVVIYSSLSKCRIWPKVMKSGGGFVPNLITFYNYFTSKYHDELDFKFDPIILSNKYTKIMNRINSKKKDHPQLVQAVKNNFISGIENILNQLVHNFQNKNKQLYQLKHQKFGISQLQQQKQEKQGQSQQRAFVLNNIIHNGLPISHIACQNSSLQTIKYLHKIGCNFELLDQQKQTSVFYAIKRGQIQLIKYLVEEVKININHREYQDRTLLYLAAFQGEINIVDYLYKMGADPELGSKLDRTPLSKACYLGNVQVVNFLLSIHVNMLKKDNKGRTALHNAVWGIEGGREGKKRGHIILQDSPECAELLLNAGHPIDLQDYDGFTPFFSSVSSHAIRSMRLLIERGTNINHKTKNEQNACFIAAKYGHLQPLKILIQQCKLNYTDPDYHGYTSLCASSTLQNPQIFIYLCNLYLQQNRKIQIKKIVQCCIQYQTANNILYLQNWIEIQCSKQQQQNKIRYLFYQLQQFIQQMNTIKTRKQQIKNTIDKNKMLRKQEWQQLSKQKQKIFKKIIEDKLKQQLQQGQDKQLQNQQKNDTLNNSIHSKSNKVKQLQVMGQIYHGLLVVTTNIALHMYGGFKNQTTALINSQQYSKDVNHNIITHLLAECVNIFNKPNSLYFNNLTQCIIKLAKILNPISPTIPPSNIYNSHQSCQLKLHHHQSQSQLIKLLTSKQVITNLVNSEQNIKNTLKQLANQRKAGVIINIFGKHEGIGKFNHDQLLKIVNGKISQNYITNTRQLKQQQISTPVSLQINLTLIEYCYLHGIFDIATYLQQICKNPQIQSNILIPAYTVKKTLLSQQETTIQLQAVQQWVFELEELYKKMSEGQKTRYRKYIQNDNDKQITDFKSCNNYNIVDNREKLGILKNQLSLSLFVGIDVQYFGISKNESFICSIQISVGDGVYVIDTLSHLQEISSKGEERLTPDQIGIFMRQLMGDSSKIKIFHAYENDVKWLHEDYNLHGVGNKVQKQYKNVNVLDTSKLYNLLHSMKKKESIGLKYLCEMYLGYQMSKNYQRSDWRIRPLFKEMVQYASIDAEVLPYIYLRMLVMGLNKQKVQEGFCRKRIMKSRGVRSQLEKYSVNGNI